MRPNAPTASPRHERPARSGRSAAARGPGGAKAAIRGTWVRSLALGRVAWRGVGYEPSRSLLVAGCIAVGIAAIVLARALGAGAEDSLDAARGGARDVVTVAAGRVRVPPYRGGGWSVSTRLRYADAEALSANVAGVAGAAAMLEGPRAVRLADAATVASVRGVEPSYVRLGDLRLGRGRLFDALDRETASRVAIVGAAVTRLLRPGTDIVGRTIYVGDVPFDVIGELAPKGLSADSSNEDLQVLIPLETAARRVFNTNRLSAILLDVGGSGDAASTRTAITELLRRNHRLAETTPDDFDVLLPIRAARAGDAQSAFVQRLLRLFSAVTVVIGGLGVLIVTYLNVSDRTWEVGLRLAIGARRRDVAALFMLEACALSTGGGLAGVLGAAVAAPVVGALTGWPVEPELRLAGLLLLGSALLGVAFGSGPAILASRSTPVAALNRV